jgi:voltage-gated potassium channel
MYAQRAHQNCRAAGEEGRMNRLKQIRWVLILPLAVLIIGTLGYMAIEKLSFLNAFYFTVTTITTVGYGDFAPRTGAGKVFTVIIIVIGVSTVLTILTNILQWLLQRQQRVMHAHRRNMLIGVFFTEVGNVLLRYFTMFDPNVGAVRQDFLVTSQWTEAEFQRLKTHLKDYAHTIDPARLNLTAIQELLVIKGDLLVRQLENTDIVENETYTELLWAVVHLRDELSVRIDLHNLPESDVAHIANDVKRAYTLLTAQWIVYMQFLKDRYPFLFSLALRTNPFVENPSPIVK